MISSEEVEEYLRVEEFKIRFQTTVESHINTVQSIIDGILAAGTDSIDVKELLQIKKDYQNMKWKEVYEAIQAKNS